MLGAGGGFAACVLGAALFRGLGAALPGGCVSQRWESSVREGGRRRGSQTPEARCGGAELSWAELSWAELRSALRLGRNAAASEAVPQSSRFPRGELR